MSDQRERLTGIVAVLPQRGRHACAARLHGARLKDLASDPDADQLGVAELRLQGKLWRNAGEHAKAAEAFAEVVRSYLRAGNTDGFLFRHALVQQAECLEAAGSLKSAAETRRLLVRFDAKRRMETAFDVLTSLRPARLLVSCVGRAVR